MSQPPYLELRTVTKTFPGTRALDRVSLSVFPGEVVALLGENGAGKSTLMKILSGVWPAGSFEGAILINQRPVQFNDTRDAHAAGIAMIHQELSVFPELTVAEHLELDQLPRWIRWNELHARTQKFLDTTSRSPSTVVYYEFMQDFNVHFKHEDGSTELVPFFGLNTKELKDVFAPSCLSCFDYVNSLADLVVGYMGAPFGWQWIVVRNDRGQQMLDLVNDAIETQAVMSKGDRTAAVQQSIPAYDKAVTLPMWVAKIMGVVIDKIGPKGLEYARFSIDSHFTRNYLFTKRNYPEKLEQHVPEFAKKIVAQYKLPE